MDVKTSYPISLSRGRSASCGSSSSRTGSPWPGLQAFRPACLGDGEHLSGRRIGHLAVHRGVRATQLGELGDERHHLLRAGVEILDVLDHNCPPFHRLAWCGHAPGAQLAQERVGGIGQQLTAGCEEVAVTVYPPERGILRDPLGGERPGLLVSTSSK